MDKELVPELRFEGFTEPWEEKKFSDAFSFLKNNTLSRANLSSTEGTVRNIHYGDVLIKYGSMIDIYNGNIPRIKDEEVAANLKYNALSDGDVVIADTAEDYTAGKCTEINNIDNIPVVAGLHTIPVRPKVHYAKGFLGHYINSNSYHKQLIQLLQGIKVISISKASISNTEISFPVIEEQGLISGILCNLDSLIAEQERKCAALGTARDALLDKMFPKEGETEPELRFDGFSGPWEQRKFSDLVLIERGGSPRPIDAYITEDPAGLNWVKIGDAPSMGRYITSTSEKIKPEGLSKTRQVYPGDLVLSNSMSFGRPYIMAVEGCIHDGWLLIRDTQNQFDPVFLCHMLGTPQMLDQYRMFASGSTVNNLNKELVGNAMVPLPNRDEQVKIGKYLDELDSLITLHQRKYERLCMVKNSMLNKMFPKGAR